MAFAFILMIKHRERLNLAFALLKTSSLVHSGGTQNCFHFLLHKCVASLCFLFHNFNFSEYFFRTIQLTYFFKLLLLLYSYSNTFLNAQKWNVYLKLCQSVLLVYEDRITSVRARSKCSIIFSREFLFELSCVCITTLIIWAIEHFW